MTVGVLGVWIIAAMAGCGDKSAQTETASSSPAPADSQAVTKKNRSDASKGVAIESSTVENSTMRTTGTGDVTPPGAKAATAEATPSDAPKPANSLEAETSPPPTPKTDDTLPRPATVEEARQSLDLTKFPLPKGAETGGKVAIASLRYELPDGDAKSMFEFVREKFAELGWKELGETYVSEQSASGTFEGKGFVAFVAIGKGRDNFSVSISNLGNVNVAKLPVPPDVKPEHLSPTSASYFTEQTADEAREAVHTLLTEQGWTPYGRDPHVSKYKQNAVELSASVLTRTEFDNKTMISYSAKQMSADLPAPPQPIEVNYMDFFEQPKQLLFESAASRDEIYQFYRDTLAKDGWQPTTEKPITDQYKAFMIFRNKAKDLIALETENPQGGKIRGILKHQSADELAEIERKLEADRPRREAEEKKRRDDEEAKKAKEQSKKAKIEQDRKDKEAAEKARRRVVLAVPAEAKDLKFDAEVITFGVAKGKARAAAESIAKQLRAAGWKEDGPPKDGILGTYTFKKDNQSVYIHYADPDPRIAPPEVRVSGFRVNFEKAENSKK